MSALPAGGRAREGLGTLPGFPSTMSALPAGGRAREGLGTLPGFPSTMSASPAGGRARGARDPVRVPHSITPAETEAAAVGERPRTGSVALDTIGAALPAQVEVGQ